MAARWRIRHKLLLGLGLAVVLMTLLLGGTLRGLWSYFLTTNRIRARLTELVAAEDVKGAVADLVSPETLAALVKSRTPLADEKKFDKVRRAFEAYGEALDAGIEQNIDPRLGLYEKSVLEKLGKFLSQHEEGVKGLRDLHLAPTVIANADGEKKRSALEERVARVADEFQEQARDLRTHIKNALTELLSDSRRHYQWALWIVVPSSGIGLLLLIGLMRSFYAWVLTPVRDLEKGVELVTAGDLSHRIAMTSGDEMEGLAVAFNAMVERLEELYKDLNKQVHERSRQAVRSERLASVGFLAAGVAHEINNPLASIAFCSEALEARLGELRARADEQEVFRKYLKMIQDEAFRCKSITGRLLEFSRTGEPKREMTEMRPLVQAVLDVTRHLPHHRGKHITFEVPSGPPLAACVNPEEIKSVVLNLVVNSLESMDDGGRLTIRLASRAGLAEIRFTDTGCGMTPEVLENIFEPFFTRSRTGKGTGLGLTISHLIITQHGGELAAASPGPGHGSTFTVRLPVHAAAEAAAPPALSRAA